MSTMTKAELMEQLEKLETLYAQDVDMLNKQIDSLKSEVEFWKKRAEDKAADAPDRSKMRHV
jgi:hypothetical protein